MGEPVRNIETRLVPGDEHQRYLAGVRTGKLDVITSFILKS